MPSVSWIVSLALFLLSFAGIIFSAFLFFRPFDEYDFSFMRVFPFEVIRTAEKNAKYYTFPIYLFSGMCFSPLILIGEGMGKLVALNPLSIIIACAFGLAGLCFVFVNVFDVTHTKAHIILFTIFAFLTLLGGVLTTVRGIIAFDLLSKHGSKEYLLMISYILSELVTVFVLVIMLNPKLRLWAKLDKVEDEYVRPKRFPLAYSEWGLLLSLFIIEISYFLQLLIK